MLPERDIAMETDHVIKAYLSGFFTFKIFSNNAINHTKSYRKLMKNLSLYHFCFLMPQKLVI